MLLACHQQDPRGLALRLPSRGIGPWRGAPPLLWRVQALVVCARRSRPVGSVWGWCRMLCLPRFFPPTPRFPLCRWRAVPSVCPLSSLAGMPFHAVCAFRGLGPIALLVFPTCPLCMCALAASAPPPLPGLVWRAHLARSQYWAHVGPFHAVRAPLRVLSPSRAPFGMLGGGAARSRFPIPGLGLCALRGVGAGVETGHQPHRARSCELALRAVGAAGGCPGGASPAWVWGFPRWALSHPQSLVLSGVPPGPTTNWLQLREVRSWRTVTNRTARAFASLLCALWGRHEGAQGGRFLPGCGTSKVGRSPTPDHSSFPGVRPGLTTHWLWVRGVRAWGPSPIPPCALLRAGFAHCEGGTRVPGGRSLLPGCPDWALPHPRPPVLWGVRPGPTTH